MLSIDRRPIMPGVTFVVSGMVLIIQNVPIILPAVTVSS